MISLRYQIKIDAVPVLRPGCVPEKNRRHKYEIRKLKMIPHKKYVTCGNANERFGQR